MSKRFGRLPGTVIMVVALSALMLAGGAAFTRSGPGLGSSPDRTTAGQVGILTTAQGDLTDVIGSLQARLRDVPGDHPAWASLATAYVQQAAISGDPTYYRRAEGAIDRSLEIEPQDNAAALTARAALAAARHDFEAARHAARRAQRINPYSGANQGVLTDALQQLGQYDKAERELQRMLDLQPGVPSFTRASYALELRGEMRPAKRALERALDVASRPSDEAYCLFYLGELAWRLGDLDGADRYYRRGLRLDPSYTSLMAGRAKVAAARGDVETAVRLHESVVRQLPTPSHLIAYADLLRSLGRIQEARRQEAVVDAAKSLFEAEGVSVDLEFALFLADRGRGDLALRAARSAWRTERSVDAADAYAWALTVAGRHRQALRFAVTAARLGTRDAKFAFHRGMIEMALGREDAARESLRRSLDINPYFSPLLVPRAQRALDRLGRS